MEFRILQRMTQHKGHTKNLYNSPQMEFRKHNRYNEVLPCKKYNRVSFTQIVQHSRVVLKEQPTNIPEDIGIGYNEELNYYINASFINVSHIHNNLNFGQTFVRGYGEKAFIATQAPIDYTLERFWQMIWEQNTKLIIMLCPLQGPKKEECTYYWVNKQEVSRVFGNQAFELTFISEAEKSPGIILRKFLLRNLRNPSEAAHEIIQIQNTRWEDDNAKADEEHFTDVDYMINKIKKLRKEEANQTVDRPHPIVVHCSAGIGRTGTIIAIYAILESIRRLHQYLDEIRSV